MNGGGTNGSARRRVSDRWRLRGSLCRVPLPRGDATFRGFGRGGSIEVVATGERDETRRSNRFEEQSRSRMKRDGKGIGKIPSPFLFFLIYIYIYFIYMCIYIKGSFRIMRISRDA